MITDAMREQAERAMYCSLQSCSEFETTTSIRCTWLILGGMVVMLAIPFCCENKVIGVMLMLIMFIMFLAYGAFCTMHGVAAGIFVKRRQAKEDQDAMAALVQHIEEDAGR